MIDIKQKFEEGYILGCIKHKEQCSLYLMPIAYWILNYKKYDPTYNPEDWEFVYRDNILIVSDENIDSYMKAIEIDKISPLELPEPGGGSATTDCSRTALNFTRWHAVLSKAPYASGSRRGTSVRSVPPVHDR